MRTAIALLVIAACASKAGDLVANGDEHPLRMRDSRARASSPDAPPILIFALDGISREILYDMLRAGELPNFAELLGGADLAHAHLDDAFVSTMPSTTMAAWVSAMTGVGPADHGVAGNEYFIRETRTFACPAPVSFSTVEPTLEIYTHHYLDRLIDSPTMYERIRATDRDALIWIAMNHVFRGADRLLLPGRAVLGKALRAFLAAEVTRRDTDVREVYAALDRGAIDTVVDHLATGATPDVLTLYIYGTDMYAHVADEGPERARRGYLHDILDPALGKLVAQLRARGLLDRLWIVVTSDHGHTEVVHDRVHALGGADGGPPAVLQRAGFRVRAFQRDVPATDPFSAVLAYGGATAYVYLADRSQCPSPRDACPWGKPPRYEEDVLAAAEAFWRDPKMKSALDMIFVRRPRPYADIDLPFEVYVGGGKTMPVEIYLRDHPHPTYVALAERLHDLAVGVHGERAGDVMLLAHDGDRDRREDRFYFAAEYHSWHGSPSHADSDIPLIVANRHHGRAEIAAWVRRTLDGRPYLKRLTDVVLGLRAGKLGQ